MRHSRTTPLRSALKGVKLPQIKTLIIPPAAYPLLQHCRDVEDVAWVVGRQEKSSDKLLSSLAPNRHSKVKRLVIPLAPQVDLSRKWSNIVDIIGSRGGNDDRLPPTSGFVAACPRLTELSVIFPYQHDTFEESGTGVRLDPARRARPAMLKLIDACKALQDFNTLQIVRLPFVPPYRICYCDGPCEYFHAALPEERWERMLGEYMKDLEEWAIDCLKRPKTCRSKKARTGCLEGGGRKGTTLRIIEFCYDYSVKVREYEL